MLGLPRQASNLAAMGECGRLPLTVFVFKKILKYWFKILQMPDHRYVKCCYKKLKRLDENGKMTWATSVKELLFRYGFGVVWLEQGVGNESLFIAEFTERVSDCFRQDWYREIHDSSKLSVYCTFKSLLEPEKYLGYINIWKFRKALAKFRCSSHNLEIEIGRHNGVLLENRLCKFCESRENIVIEDEYHFLLCCPRYERLRNRYLDRRYFTNPTFELFINLMSSQDVNTVTNVAFYIFHANRLRNDT